MNGAGFMMDMIISSRNNRRNLKGDKSGKYQNFDKSYITDSILSRKSLKFKTASPEFLKALNLKLLKEKRQLNRNRLIVLVISTIVTAGLFAIIFS